jgi:predicted O-linked N-acetylglucosamine transferase (SPINDLY family)
MEFNNLYNDITKSPSLKKQGFKEKICNIGLEFIKMKSEVLDRKHEIITKLIFLFPEEADLYFHMGHIFVKTSPLSSLMWFRLCYEKKPTDYDNLCEYGTLLVKNGMHELFWELDKDDLFSDIIHKKKDNYRFLELYVNSKQPNLMYKDVMTCFEKMIQSRGKNAAKTEAEKNEKWWAYHHAGFGYVCVADIPKALQRTQKALDLANKFEMSNFYKLLSFQNLVAFHDFEYNDHKENFRLYQQVENYMPTITDLFTHNRPLHNKKKISIGYVSSDFIEHPVSNFILPILKNHKREHFDIFLFSNGRKEEDFDNIVTDCNIFIIENMNDKEAAKLIYKNNIDVLIDLNGHTVRNRLDIFAYNPAPIQMTYIGYPNTTGMKSIQYRITDSIVDPIDSCQPYSEELIRLNTCFLLFESIHYTRPCVPKRVDSTRIVLGALNKEKKNSLYVLETWKRILQECPNTVIIIKMETFDNRDERFRYYSEILGVDESRLEIWNKLPNPEYNNMFSKIDILLDTYPYSGTTTTCEALFHSVPVVTMTHKDYHCHNVSASLMKNCGLDKLVTRTPQEYIDVVKNLVEFPEKIEEYKRTIHTRFVNSMNKENFMREYEKAIIDVYNKKNVV